MGRCLNPQYGHVILVSGYPVLTAVNNMDVQYQVAAPNLASMTFHIGNPVVRTDDHVTTKISEMVRKPEFLS